MWESRRLRQRIGAGGGDELGEFFVGGLLALVDPLEVADQLCGHSTAGLAGGIPGAHLR
jgi:hypothetical protein